MKKLIFSLTLTVLCTTAGAQGMLDALNFGKLNYYGTARTMAIGNATTAVGSDIGSIEINPAGAAVANYSQVSFTPGISIASTDASYFRGYSIEGQPDSGAPGTVNSTRFVVPNAGFTFVVPMGYRGLKSLTFGIVSNITSNYLESHRANGSGDNSYTSITGAFALAANDSGMPGDIIGRSSPYSSEFSWNSITSYFAKMINFNPVGNYYFGSAEGLGIVGGNMYQSSGATKTGTNNDILLNFSGNVDDRFYFGVNLGIPNGTYRNNEFYTESPVNCQEFPITPMDYKTVEEDTFYKGSTYNYSYIASLSGIYGKFGFIALPTSWLRLGASIKTPTAYTIRERWQISCETVFERTSANANYHSPEGSYSYRYRSPWEVNAGIAATIGGIVMLSADYEMTDFSHMRFDGGNSFNDPFQQANALIGRFCGASHSLRTGVEFNLANVLFFRGGFGFITDPERTLWDTKENCTVTAAEYANRFYEYDRDAGRFVNGSYVHNPVTTYSAGIGFRSRGAFFADLAVRMTKSNSSYQPYNDYYSVDCGYPDNIASPFVNTTKRLWDIALTLGFRF